MSEKPWISVCEIDDLMPDTGVCALVNQQQVAIFRSRRLNEIFAISNYDPIGEANVLSRGIIGSIGDEVVVASPLYKEHYNLRTGETKLLFKSGGRASPGLFNPRNGQLLTTTTIEPTPDGLEQRIKIRRAGSDEFELHEAFSRKIKDRYTMAIVGIDEAFRLDARSRVGLLPGLVLTAAGNAFARRARHRSSPRRPRARHGRRARAVGLVGGVVEQANVRGTLKVKLGPIRIFDADDVAGHFVI